jgi:hypothetical protein
MGRTACTEPQCLYSRAIPLLSLWAVRPVQNLSFCTRVTFTFTFKYQISWKILLLEGELFRVDSQTTRHRDVTKLIFSFRYLTNAPTTCAPQKIPESTQKDRPVNFICVSIRRAADGSRGTPVHTAWCKFWLFHANTDCMYSNIQIYNTNFPNVSLFFSKPREA